MKKSFILVVIILLLFSGCKGSQPAFSRKSYKMIDDLQITEGMTLTKNELKQEIFVDIQMDLNSDKVEEVIKIDLYPQNSEIESCIVSNNNTIKRTFENPYKVLIVDLNKKDDYFEIAIFDDGPSGDPKVVFFRYVDDNILEIGEIRSDVLCDENGRMISTWELSPFDPTIVFSHYTIEDNQIMKNSEKYELKKDKTYSIFQDKQMFFYPLPKKENLESLNYSEEYVVNLKKGEKVEIKEIEIENNHALWYRVKYQKQDGLLYDWSGD